MSVNRKVTAGPVGSLMCPRSWHPETTQLIEMLGVVVGDDANQRGHVEPAVRGVDAVALPAPLTEGIDADESRRAPRAIRRKSARHRIVAGAGPEPGPHPCPVRRVG